MKRLSCALILLFALSYLCLAEDEEKDVLCTWTAVRFTTPVSERWKIGAMAELRTKLEAFDQFYLRPFADYNAGSGFHLKYQTDFAFFDTDFKIRIIPELSYTHSFGDFSVLLRQRYMGSWSRSNSQWSSLLRTQGLIQYNIPSIRISPIVAVEPFYWDELARVRYYAGFKIKLNENSSLQVQYVRQDFSDSSKQDQNIIWLLYSITLPH